MDAKQLPPQAIEAEMSVLGGIFVDNDILGDVQGLLEISDFYRESHRTIFRAMSALSDRGEPIDLITTTTELRKSGGLEEAGGAAYLAALVDYVPMAANTLYYCKIVVQKARERRMISNAQEAIQIVYSGGDIEEAQAKLEMAAQPFTDKRGRTTLVCMDESVRVAVKRIEHRHENAGAIQGLPYGIEGLDRKTSGMHPGDLIIVAGRPSMGKSAFAGNVLTNVGTMGKAGMLFTLEMARDDVTDRFIASYGIKYHHIRNGQLRDYEWSEVTKAATKLHDMRLYIDDTPAISLKDVRVKARQQKRKGLHLIVIDYLQLMRLPNPKDGRVQGLGEITRGLKQLARELEIPVILLSQLNRAVDSRPDTRPTMSDLRDSGEIEQDADVILFPYRPAAYCKKCRDRVEDATHNYREHQAEAEIIIEKQRAGERNLSIPACWRGEYQKFVGL